tara:strand:+ start:12376 stop:12534 length:159 start_codon:yes stop_codon:yes gene_type:complete
MPALLLIPVGLAALGFFVDKTGEGIESASNGIIKVAVVGAGIYFVAKKAKVI